MGLDIKTLATVKKIISDTKEILTDSSIISALGYTPINSDKIGSVEGIASLDSNGKVPASQLPSYVNDAILESAISNHNTSESSHNDIRDFISELTTRLNTLADCDDTTLDQLSEIVDYIKNNKSLIDGVTTSKVNVSDIIDNLISTATNKPLSAKQGKILNDLITVLTTTVGDKVDKVDGKGLSTNDYTTTDKNKLDGIASGAEVNVQSDWNVTDVNSDAFIKNKPTSMPASDVSAWAKSDTKPTYTKSDIGLGNVDNTADADKEVKYAESATKATQDADGKVITDTYVKKAESLEVTVKSFPQGAANTTTNIDSFSNGPSSYTLRLYSVNVLGGIRYYAWYYRGKLYNLFSTTGESTCDEFKITQSQGKYYISFTFPSMPGAKVTIYTF